MEGLFAMLSLDKLDKLKQKIITSKILHIRLPIPSSL